MPGSRGEPCDCVRCEHVAEWVPREKPDPECGVKGHDGGWQCEACGHFEKYEPDED